MLFNSYEFIFLFLPLVLLGYFVVFRWNGRTTFLTLMSYLFYGWWDYRFCGLMLFCSLIDYLAGMKIGASTEQPVRKRWLVAALTANLTLLGFFKYFDLMAGTLNYGLGALFPSVDLRLPLLHLILPVGISFYTFQSMSYSIDVYRNQVKPVRSFLDFSCYVALFPQLVAGPIVRYSEIAEQLVQRTHSWTKASKGVSFFIIGLAKKVILADGVALLVDLAFGQQPPGLLGAWVGLLSYAMQIYFDFSAYSDMAVGLGLIIGFQFPQNFNSPYKSISITDFWRRWHMSLSSWLRDYLYIPLGGNKKGPIRTYVNLTLTMLLGGLWHGANWTFVIWGAYHGLLLAIERASRHRSLFGWSPEWMQRGFTFLLAIIGWVFFRATSLDQCGSVFSGLLGLHGAGLESVMNQWQEVPWSFWLLGLTLLLAMLAPNSWEMMERIKENGELKKPLSFILYPLSLLFLFLISVATMLVNSSSPFLYFQF